MRSEHAVVSAGLATAEGGREPLLDDPDLEAQLSLEGYCVVPMLAPDELAAMREAYESTHPGPGFGFDIDFAYINPSHKQAVWDVLAPTWERFRDRYATRAVPFLSTFVAKWPGEASELRLHQDWSYVEEDTERAFIVWVALDDVSAELDNGPLRLIPGSHLWPGGLRGANTIEWYVPYRPHLDEHTATIPMRAGEGLILDSRIVHGSAPNRSSSPRIAATCRYALAGTDLRYAHLAPDGLVDVYSVDAAFFRDRGPMDLAVDPPSGYEVLRREQPYAGRLSDHELARLLGTDVPPVPNDGLDVGHHFGPERPVPAAVFGPERPDPGAPPWPADLTERLPDLRRDLRAFAWSDEVQGKGWRIRRIVGPGCLDEGDGRAAALALLAGLPVPVQDGWLMRVDPGGCIVWPAVAPSLPVRVLVVDAPGRVGTCFVEVASTQLVLEAGTAVSFDASSGTRMWNNGGEPCIALVWVHGTRDEDHAPPGIRGLRPHRALSWRRRRRL